MENLVYFELNNWFSGRDYPDEEPFRSWVRDDQFGSDEWCKKNKLVVMKGPIDMSLSWCVIAPKEWIERECPALLSSGSYNYDLMYGNERRTHERKYSDFLCEPDENGEIYGHITGWKFPEYCESNFGVQWNNSYWEDLEDDEEENSED